MVASHESRPPQLRRRARGALVGSRELSAEEVQEWRARVQAARVGLQAKEQGEHLQMLGPLLAR